MLGTHTVTNYDLESSWKKKVGTKTKIDQEKKDGFYSDGKKFLSNDSIEYNNSFESNYYRNNNRLFFSYIERIYFLLPFDYIRNDDDPY